MYQKFSSDQGNNKNSKNIRGKLLQTLGNILAYQSENKFWGTGHTTLVHNTQVNPADWVRKDRSQNLLGYVLMKARDQIFKDLESFPKYLENEFVWGPSQMFQVLVKNKLAQNIS
jgi:hypothetical protein